MELKKICKERGCGKEFVITNEEQTFYKQKGWELPARCKACRDKRKAEKESGK